MHFKKRRGGAAFVVECTLIGGMVEIDCTLSTLGVRVEVLLYCAPLPLTLDQSPLRLPKLADTAGVVRCPAVWRMITVRC